jgi:uncharacterized protein YkwD
MMFAQRLTTVSLLAALALVGLALSGSGAAQAGEPSGILGPAATTSEESATPIEAPFSPFTIDYSGCGGVTVSVTNAAYEQQVVELVNAQRLANGGLPPYKRVDTLDAAARYHANDMAQDNYFEHNSYDRDGQNQLVQVCTWSTRINTYYTGVRGENIAAGYHDPASVMNGWMNSSGHRANILSSAWEIGVGFYQGGSWGTYWVQDFGRRSNVYPLVINREAALTATRDVTLYLYGSGVFQEMRLKNDNGAYTSWQPFQSNLPWTLSGCNGAKTVTAELRNNSSTVTSTDAISLAASPRLVLGDLPDSLKFVYSLPEQRLYPPQGTIAPQNSGDGCAAPYTVSAEGGWFNLSALSGTTPEPFTVTPTDFYTATTGIYTGTLTVSIPGAIGSPQSISLSLEVVDQEIFEAYFPLVSR